MDQIESVANLHGNSSAMIKLIFMLHDRDDKWFVHLVAATRKCGYLLDDIDPRLKEAGHNILNVTADVYILLYFPHIFLHGFCV